MRRNYNRKFHIINSGYSGSNTREAKARFDWLVRDFKPDMVVITFAGNDAINRPERFIAEDEFKANMEYFIQEIRSWGGTVILQTYYKPDLDEVPYADNIVKYMQYIRDIAEKNNVFLVDQYKFFDKLDRNTHLYKLLLNSMHLNEEGNILMGCILAKHLGLEPEKVLHNEKLLFALKLLELITGEAE